MTNLSDAAEILRQSKKNKEIQDNKPINFTSTAKTNGVSVHTLKAASGISVRMMDDDPKKINIAEMSSNPQPENNQK